jgi:hypothetical protein
MAEFLTVYIIVVLADFYMYTAELYEYTEEELFKIIEELCAFTESRSADVLRILTSCTHALKSCLYIYIYILKSCMLYLYLRVVYADRRVLHGCWKSGINI